MENRCFACMNKINSPNDICSHCGNDNSIIDFDPKKQLEPSCILRERYLVGLAIEQNGEGVTYMGYDTVDRKRVRIRELFPDSLCHREASGAVSVNLGCEIQFKSLMVDFGELAHILIDLKPNSCILKAKKIFGFNNTLYTIFEDVSGVTLTRYLLDCAGELSWDEAEVLFLPLLHAIKILNGNGIIHRGISPDTIIVTKNNELKLTGICTSGVRANNSEIKAELFVGYAAPEQYQKCTSYGEWTDVYSISAVLYKTLTGTMPPRADTRDDITHITSAKELNHNVPQTISDAIARGLAYNKKERTLYIKDLIGDLYAITPADLQRQNRQDEFIEERHTMTKKKFKVPIWLTVILVTVPIMLLLLYLAYQFILGPSEPQNAQTSVPVTSTVPTTSTSTSAPVADKKSSEESVNNMAVLDFVGKIYDDIVVVDGFKEMYHFVRKDVYNDLDSIGTIVEQSMEVDKIVPIGSEITLMVSKGPQHVTMPPLVDATGISITVSEYTEYLTKNGVKVTVENKASDSVAYGEIVELSVPVGSSIDREVVNSVVIYVAE